MYFFENLDRKPFLPVPSVLKPSDLLNDPKENFLHNIALSTKYSFSHTKTKVTKYGNFRLSLLNPLKLMKSSYGITDS